MGRVGDGEILSYNLREDVLQYTCDICIAISGGPSFSLRGRWTR